jgi:AcrR family transcriptional regulator
MGNKARSPEVIDFEKRRMSLAAKDIIAKDGYNNLSIRKLSKKLGVSPSTVYNYFKSREEIYIYVLNAGFEMLFEELNAAYNSHEDPVEKLKALCRAFFSFSIRERDLMFIMLILDTPKYYDYLKTDYEPFMRIELANALKCRDTIVRILNDMAEKYPSFHKEDIPYRALIIIHQLIGLVTIYLNKVITYVTDDIEAGAEMLLNEIWRPFEVIRNEETKKPTTQLRK